MKYDFRLYLISFYILEKFLSSKDRAFGPFL